MIVEVEIAVVHPDRMIELNRRQYKLALEERNEMKTVFQMVTKGRKDIAA